MASLKAYRKNHRTRLSTDPLEPRPGCDVGALEKLVGIIAPLLRAPRSSGDSPGAGVLFLYAIKLHGTSMPDSGSRFLRRHTARRSLAQLYGPLLQLRSMFVWAVNTDLFPLSWYSILTAGGTAKM